MSPSFSKDLAIIAQYNYITFAVLAVDIINTWYCTGSICYRLYSILQQKRATANAYSDVEADIRAGSPYQKIIRVFIQSGMPFSILEAACVVCVLTGSKSGRYIVDHMSTRIVGIGTALIIIQLNSSPPPSSNPQESPSGDYSMPIFRRRLKEDPTTDGVDTKGVPQSSTYDGGIEHPTPPLTAYAGQPLKKSSTYEDGVKHAISYSAPCEGQCFAL
ncbi:hypothetical protein FRB94_005070 [Tulasnella sp. JGI-2019a]|nr:hypothetical protein FRB94_005070 [Tulasnella sp. JGI-2019a]